jgi:uncharacterized repeat protein (TIGR03843 family)
VQNVSKTIAHLTGAELKVTGRLVDASNATLYATANFQGTEIACIYKPIAGERPLWDFQTGNLASRELAAFMMSDRLELNLVPPTVLRDGPYGQGMVQAWIDIDTNIDLMTFFQRDDSNLKSLALFDAIINNTDRKIGHLLPTPEGKLFACDHGVTFHQDDKLRTVLWQWAGQAFSDAERHILQKSRTVLQNHQFAELLTDEEIQATLNRIEKLLEEGNFPHPSEDWPAVPWPPF